LAPSGSAMGSPSPGLHDSRAGRIGRLGAGRSAARLEGVARGKLRRFAERLGEPVDGASLAFFRAAFGALVAANVVRWFVMGKIHDVIVEPDFHFTYFGWGWVRPWPGDLPYLHFAVVGLLALCVAAGLWYRVTSALVAIGVAQWFLWEKAVYQNHYYLITLLALLLAVVPAHRAWSLDARRHPPPGGPTVPLWSLLLLRFQVGVPYVFAGLAKLNPDWLRGEPLRMWLEERREMPLFGPLLAVDATAYALSYGGLLLDLLVVPALLWRRTRVLAYVAAAVFHVLNEVLFDIGIFPLLMLAATTIFFEPNWPRALGRRLRLGPAPDGRAEVARPGALLVTGLGLFALLQLFLPLRHYLYPGDVSWTEEGHRFSWRMKLRDKSGAAYLTATDVASGRSWTISPWDFLNQRQVDEMWVHPDMLAAFSRHVAARERERGREVEVRARVSASLNGRPAQVLVDPEVDLASLGDSLLPADWIVPLEVPLRAGSKTAAAQTR